MLHELGDLLMNIKCGDGLCSVFSRFTPALTLLNVRAVQLFLA